MFEVASDSDLGFRVSGSPRVGNTGEQELLELEGDVNRRELLRAIVATGLVPPSLTALDDARTAVDRLLACDTGKSVFWEQTAERYSYGYHGQPPLTVLADLSADFVGVEEFLGRNQSVAGRTNAWRVTAQLAGMIGIVLHDLGRADEAHRWFGTALTAARETQDGPLESWILSRQAMVPLNFGAPRIAADIAARALAVAGRRPSAPMALAASVAARSYASMGRHDMSFANLDLAETAFERLGDAQTTDTWFGYPEQKHYVHASQALTMTGSTARAYVAQSRALELTRSPLSMSAALVEVDRATCLKHDGETEEGLSVAYRAIDALPVAFRTDLVLSRAKTLMRAVPLARSARVSDASDALRNLTG